MNDEEELSRTIRQLSYICGVSISLLHDYSDYFSEHDRAIFKWIEMSTENALSLKTPLEPLP